MGRLMEGQWVTADLGPDAQGNYVRRVTQFRNKIGDEQFPLEPKRYRLIVSHACGWSHRCLLIRALKGLEGVIPVTVAQPFMGENGWTFENLTGDLLDSTTENNPEKKKKKDISIKFMHVLYVLAKPDYTGRASVPVLWDMKTGTIVNNESSDLVHMFAKDFESLATRNSGDIVPENLQDAIQEMTDANYGPINNGVYRCGFAGSQKAYDDAVTVLFDRLEFLEDLLGRQRYLMGNDQITLADLCLFPTLYRFDHIYYTHFKCNKKHLYEMPNLWGYTREIYQWTGVQETCNLHDIKVHYYTSHESIHPRRYIPIGPDIDFNEPHGRGDREYTSL